MELEELKALLPNYVGGEVEAQNSVECYCYRGRITGIDVVKARVGYDDEIIVVTLAWQTYAPLHGRRLTARRREVGEPDKLVYRIEATLPYTDASATDGVSNKVYLALIGPGEEGGGDRLHGRNPYTCELTTFFPSGGSQLDQSAVDWLPNGPYSRTQQ